MSKTTPEDIDIRLCGLSWELFNGEYILASSTTTVADPQYDKVEHNLGGHYLNSPTGLSDGFQRCHLQVNPLVLRQHR